MRGLRARSNACDRKKNKTKNLRSRPSFDHHDSVATLNLL